MGPKHAANNEIYSQNRLRRRLLRRLLARSSIAEGDLVYDIGAGDGVITEELARKGVQVIAIEKDNRLFAKLKQKLGSNPLVTVRHGDFLIETLPQQSKYKVFANIPFILTAEIVRKLLFNNQPPDDCYLVVQKEAAEKLTGIPVETLFSLLLKPWFELRISYHFQKTDFFPIPTVDITLLHIHKREPSLVPSPQAPLYRDFLVYGFRQGKPTVRTAFGEVLTYVQFERLSRKLGFSPEASPRELTLSQWLGLFQFFTTSATRARKNLVSGAERRFRREQSCRKRVHRTYQVNRYPDPERRRPRPFKSGTPVL